MGKRQAVRAQRNKKGEIHAEYGHITDKNGFRFRMLKNIMALCGDSCFLVLDTNQCVSKNGHAAVMEALKTAGQAPMLMRMAANPHMYLGFRYRPQKADEWMIVCRLSAADLTEELFCALSAYDMALCIAPRQPMEVIYEELRVCGLTLNTELFEKVYYDSIVCERLRSTFDIQKPIEDAVNEMGL